MSPKTAPRPAESTEPRFDTPADAHAERPEPTAPYAPLGLPEFWPAR
jgi:hypothetical protein